ncbi:hypothetical protein [Clostridium sp.]|jgi:hypothetical protein|uniref:hypothetical protein n=1 Tax=Clostridium sp. TaxID=1506 RepID=UPI003EEA2FEF
MFKRKQAKPPEIGSLCTIKKEIINKLWNLKKYKNNSASMKAQNAGGVICNYFFSKPKLIDVFFADFDLLYIKRKSIFTGFVEVEGLVVNSDHLNGIGLSHYLRSKKKYFTVSLESLNIATDSQAETIMKNTYNGRQVSRIFSRINSLKIRF